MKNILALLFALFSSILAFSQYSMGLPEGPDPIISDEPEKAVQSYKYRSMLPSSVALDRYAPTPKSQESFGTCAAWATVYGGRTMLEAMRYNSLNQAQVDALAFTPAFSFKLVKPNDPTCWGAHVGSIVQSMEQQGALPLNKWGRKGEEYHCPKYTFEQELYQIASNYKVVSHQVLFTDQGVSDDNDKKIVTTKESLANGQPVIISMITPNSFHTSTSPLWQPEENPKFGQHGRHAMVVIGYDNAKFGGAFHIQNSWGTSYRENGRVWVKYADYAKWVYQAVALFKLPEIAAEKTVYKGSLDIWSVTNSTNDRRLPVTLADPYRNWSISQQAKNSDYTYRIEEALHTGDEIRLVLNSYEVAYAYIIGSGSKFSKTDVLFPTAGISALLSNKSNQITLPGDNSTFKLDANTGNSYLALLLSSEPIDIVAACNNLNTMSGTFSDKLRLQFGEKLIPRGNMSFGKSNVSFDVKSSGDASKIAVLIIENDHLPK